MQHMDVSQFCLKRFLFLPYPHSCASELAWHHKSSFCFKHFACSSFCLVYVKHVVLEIATLSSHFFGGISFQIIKQKIENMKVDRTKLKKTPTEAVSIQKFALFFHFRKSPGSRSTILIFKMPSLICIKCNKTASCLETNLLLNFP